MSLLLLSYVNYGTRDKGAQIFQKPRRHLQILRARKLTWNKINSNSTQHSPAWEANRFSASQEIPRTL